MQYHWNAEIGASQGWQKINNHFPVLTEHIHFVNIPECIYFDSNLDFPKKIRILGYHFFRKKNN